MATVKTERQELLEIVHKVNDYRELYGMTELINQFLKAQDAINLKQFFVNLIKERCSFEVREHFFESQEVLSSNAFLRRGLHQSIKEWAGKLPEREIKGFLIDHSWWVDFCLNHQERPEDNTYDASFTDPFKKHPNISEWTVYQISYYSLVRYVYTYIMNSLSDPDFWAQLTEYFEHESLIGLSQADLQTLREKVKEAIENNASKDVLTRLEGEAFRQSNYASNKAYIEDSALSERWYDISQDFMDIRYYLNEKRRKTNGN